MMMSSPSNQSNNNDNNNNNNNNNPLQPFNHLAVPLDKQSGFAIPEGEAPQKKAPQEFKNSTIGQQMLARLTKVQKITDQAKIDKELLGLYLSISRVIKGWGSLMGIRGSFLPCLRDDMVQILVLSKQMREKRQEGAAAAAEAGDKEKTAMQKKVTPETFRTAMAIFSADGSESFKKNLTASLEAYEAFMTVKEVVQEIMNDAKKLNNNAISAIRSLGRDKEADELAIAPVHTVTCNYARCKIEELAKAKEEADAKKREAAEGKQKKAKPASAASSAAAKKCKDVWPETVPLATIARANEDANRFVRDFFDIDMMRFFDLSDISFEDFYSAKAKIIAFLIGLPEANPRTQARWLSELADRCTDQETACKIIIQMVYSLCARDSTSDEEQAFINEKLLPEYHDMLKEMDSATRLPPLLVKAKAVIGEFNARKAENLLPPCIIKCVEELVGTIESIPPGRASVIVLESVLKAFQASPAFSTLRPVDPADTKKTLVFPKEAFAEEEEEENEEIQRIVRQFALNYGIDVIRNNKANKTLASTLLSRFASFVMKMVKDLGDPQEEGEEGEEEGGNEEVHGAQPVDNDRSSSSSGLVSMSGGDGASASSSCMPPPPSSEEAKKKDKRRSFSVSADDSAAIKKAKKEAEEAKKAKEEAEKAKEEAEKAKEEMEAALRKQQEEFARMQAEFALKMKELEDAKSAATAAASVSTSTSTSVSTPNSTPNSKKGKRKAATEEEKEENVPERRSSFRLNKSGK
jgi:hypothetical protein